jgi:hypothetical protein
MSAKERAEFTSKMLEAASRKLDLDRRQEEIMLERGVLKEDIELLMSKYEASTTDHFYERFPGVVDLLGLGRWPGGSRVAEIKGLAKHAKPDNKKMTEGAKDPDVLRLLEFAKLGEDQVSFADLFKKPMN